MGEYGAGNYKFRGEHQPAPAGGDAPGVPPGRPQHYSGNAQGLASSAAGRHTLGAATSAPKSYSSIQHPSGLTGGGATGFRRGKPPSYSKAVRPCTKVYVRPDGQLPRGRHSSQRAERFRRNNKDWDYYSKQMKGGTTIRTASPSPSITHTPLSYEETRELMSRKNRFQLYESDDTEIEQWIQDHDTARVPELMEREQEIVNRWLHKESEEAPVHGWLSENKEEGVQRFLFSNVNGMSTWKTKNRKASIIADLAKTYDIDLMGFVECGINWGYYKTSQTLSSLFKLDKELRSVQAANTSEHVNRSSQHGGTGMVVAGEAIQYAKKSGKDPRNLGRWTWYLLEGEPNHRT